MSDLKQGTCEPVHEAETDSQMENGRGCQGLEEGRVGSVGLTDTDLYTGWRDKKGPTV